MRGAAAGLVLLGALSVGASGCAWLSARGPALEADGAKIAACIAEHYDEIASAPDEAQQLAIVSLQCGERVAPDVLRILVSAQRVAMAKRAGAPAPCTSVSR